MYNRSWEREKDQGLSLATTSLIFLYKSIRVTTRFSNIYRLAYFGTEIIESYLLSFCIDLYIYISQKSFVEIKGDIVYSSRTQRSKPYISSIVLFGRWCAPEQPPPQSHVTVLSLLSSLYFVSAMTTHDPTLRPRSFFLSPSTITLVLSRGWVLSIVYLAWSGGATVRDGPPRIHRPISFAQRVYICRVCRGDWWFSPQTKKTMIAGEFGKAYERMETSRDAHHLHGKQ
jgi:hypothetical protein